VRNLIGPATLRKSEKPLHSRLPPLAAACDDCFPPLGRTIVPHHLVQPRLCYNRLFGVLLWLLPATGAVAQAARESDIKAAFIYNFAAFIDWPQQAFRDDEAPFVIGIFGADSFGPTLEQLTAGERAKDRPIVVRRLTRLTDVTACQILFISASEAGRVTDILRHCTGRAILTVSDAPGFVEMGGMIAFSREEGRILLYVNTTAAEAAELVISSKLLRVARVVRGTGGAP
jgi:hypothetical protein